VPSKNKEVRAILIHGDQHEVSLRLSKVIEKVFGTSSCLMGVTTISEPDIFQIRSLLFSSSLFGSGRMVVLESPAINAEVVDTVEGVIGVIPSDTYLVVAEKNGNIQPSLKKRLKTVCKKYGIEFHYPAIRRAGDAVDFARKELASNGLEPTGSAVKTFVSYVGFDRCFISAEAEKLGIVCSGSVSDSEMLKYLFPSADEYGFLSLYKEIESGDSYRAGMVVDDMIADKIDLAQIVMSIAKLLVIASSIGVVPDSARLEDPGDVERMILGFGSGSGEDKPSQFMKKLATLIKRRVGSDEEISELVFELHSFARQARLQGSPPGRLYSVLHIICGGQG